MRNLALIGFAVFWGATANATIDGPSCDELTKKQEALLLTEAKRYIAGKANKEIKIPRKTIKATNIDCHDYDGVHSTSEFEVEWIQVDNDQEMSCRQVVAVSVTYENKLKVIDEESTFEFDDLSEAECEN